MHFTRFALAALLAGSLTTSAQAQLLKNIKDKAAGAMQGGSVDIPIGRKKAAAGSGASESSGRPTSTKPNIYFDTTPPAEGARPERDSFTPTDNIYASIPLPGTLADFIKASEIEPNEQDGKLYLPVYVSVMDGGGHGYESLDVLLRPEDMGKRTLTLDILPAPGKATTPYRIGNKTARPASSVFLSVGGNYVPYGKHPFLLKVGRNEEFKGAFELTIPDKATATALAARIEADRKQLERTLDMATELPAVLKGPQGKFTDPGLTDAAVRKLLGPDLIRYVIEPGSSDYSVVYNSLGVPMRKVSRDVWAIYKDEDGMCVCAHVQFVRQHEGGGKYGAPTRLQHVQDNVIIACEKAK